jgi:anti-sigma regulatory factor (Ser/Thr protein kinase)
MAGLNRLGSWIDHVSAALRLAAGAEYALRLCLEEAVANVVMHGGPCSAAERVTISLHADSSVLHITVEDACAPFDPTSWHEAQVGLDQPGGRGLRLMRQYASSVSYRRTDDANQLALTIGRS